MAVIISQVKTDVDAGESEIISAALRKAGIAETQVKKCGICKISLDARDNSNMRLVSSVRAELESSGAEHKLCARNKFCSEVVSVNVLPPMTEPKNKKIVIAGFGPAGMFAALTLAEYGYRPIVAERGGSVDERVKAVSGFWNGGKLDVSTNVQFGEGGAGTFSDGKLTTRIKDPLCGYVLEKFTEFGAPEEILCKAKPHIGTDRLRSVVKNLRERVIALGGEVRFHSAVTDISAENGNIRSVLLNGSEEIPCDALIMSVGHSARDTFEMLMKKGVLLEAKPFSVGARIEHTQESVNRSLYGRHFANPVLPKGEYQLSYRQGERAVYTFCMCPGGTVVPAASEENSVVTNGMSEFARDGVNADSALVVSVSPDDFGRGPLDGVDFARSIERKAFELAGRNCSAPAVSVGSFLDGGSSLNNITVEPSYALGVSGCCFDELFPKFVTDMMRTGLKEFAKKMKCFGDRGAVLTAPETRTSSPVRIMRGENMQSVSLSGLYPCGEGAGYAGGIMSAAVDGVKCALKIMEE